MKFQDLIEERKAAMPSNSGDNTKLPTGRQFAKLAIDELEIDKEFGYLVGQDYLLELKIAGTGWKDLQMFQTKADLSLKLLPAVERPSESTLRRWLQADIVQEDLQLAVEEARQNSAQNEARGKPSQRLGSI